MERKRFEPLHFQSAIGAKKARGEPMLRLCPAALKGLPAVQQPSEYVPVGSKRVRRATDGLRLDATAAADAVAGKWTLDKSCVKSTDIVEALKDAPPGACNVALLPDGKMPIHLAAIEGDLNASKRFRNINASKFGPDRRGAK